MAVGGGSGSKPLPALDRTPAALTLALTLTPNLLGGDAYGGWTDVPAAASATDAHAAENDCRAFWLDFAKTPGEGLPELQVIEDADRVLAEQRGEFTYTVLSDGTWAMDCLVQTRPGFSWFDGGGGSSSGAGSLQPLGDGGELARDGVADLIVGGMGGQDLDGTVLMLYGRVGADVRAAVVHTPGVGDVEATVTNGFVAAWAPGLPRDAFDEPAIGMTLYLADGSTADLTPDEVWAAGLSNGS